MPIKGVLFQKTFTC